MSKPDIQRLLELQKLLQSFNEIDRRVHRRQGDEMRPENDTEHSYNLAMTAWYLAPHFPELDQDLLIRYALVHDLVEIHAGDTYIYGSHKELSTKVDREKQAAERLLKDWADFPEMHELIEKYETKANAEARFVYALDKIMPIMLIYNHEGYTWKKEGITTQQLHANKLDKVAISPEILGYYEQLHDLLLASPEFIPPN